AGAERLQPLPARPLRGGAVLGPRGAVPLPESSPGADNSGCDLGTAGRDRPGASGHRRPGRALPLADAGPPHEEYSLEKPARYRPLSRRADEGRLEIGLIASRAAARP